MGVQLAVVEVRDDVTVFRCNCEGLEPTMHTVLNTHIEAGHLQAELDRIRADAAKRLAAKKAATAAVNAIPTG